jgi:hypothetical protein
VHDANRELPGLAHLVRVVRLPLDHQDQLARDHRALLDARMKMPADVDAGRQLRQAEHDLELLAVRHVCFLQHLPLDGRCLLRL